MLTIRQEQVDVFEQHHLQEFEDDMVAHLQKFAPKHWQAIDEPTGREVIRLGIKQAKKYGFTNRGPVRFYIELIFMFGTYFDTDPQIPWASSVLNDPVTIDQDTRADRLFNAMSDYLIHIAGPKNEYTLRALRRLSETRAEDYMTPAEPLEEGILRGLRSVYPEKFEYSGNGPLRALIREGFDLAHRCDLDSDSGVVLIVTLMFAIGHGFAADPLYTPIAKRLDDRRWPNPQERVDKLYASAMAYLKHTLVEHGEG